MDKSVPTYPLAIRFIHAGLVIFGLTAYLTGELAEAEHGLTAGYWLHAYLGLTLTVFIFSRFIYGIFSVNWSITRRFSGIGYLGTAILEDIHDLLRLRMPMRLDHGGLARLVQTFGLLIFLWMAVTGIILFILGDPEASGFAHAVAEAHEAGEYLIPMFLFLHIGAVILHTLTGHHILQRINPFMK